MKTRTLRNTSNDLKYLQLAVELSAKAPPSQNAFSVGCVIVSARGEIIGTGFSRELRPQQHAEEAAMERAEKGGHLAGATLYASLEPCSVRKSGRMSCCAHIIDAGISRVVFALAEPPTFVHGHGADVLRMANVTVDQFEELRSCVEQVNAHLLNT